MPKIKTHSGAKKRFNLTKTGKVKRAHAFKSHILTKKDTKRKRGLRAGAYADKTNESAIKRIGVSIRARSRRLKVNPSIIITAHTTPLTQNEVCTAVRISPILRAPYSWEIKTEQPMLHPIANARKISVIS